MLIGKGRSLASVYRPLKPKHQRLDGDRHGAGGLQDFAEVDEVEVVERDAVDGEDVVFEVEMFLRMLVTILWLKRSRCW